jgi:transposase
MPEVASVGLDLAKDVFHLRGADASERAALRRKLRRRQVLEVLAGLPRCTVAMEACGGARYWGREIGKLGHDVRSIPPGHVKPFVRRQKNE